MTLDEFCKALHLPNVGSWEEVPSDSDIELKNFWKTISVDETGLIHRGKLSQIQHPGLRYFALFLVKGFLPRKNSTACTGPVLHLLKCAKEGVASNYNLGVMLARTLSYSVFHNESKPLFAGAIATMIHDYIKTEINSTYGGTEVPGSNLLDLEMLLRMKILLPWGDNFYLYCYMVKSGGNPLHSSSL